jgi:hypothetical protein
MYIARWAHKPNPDAKIIAAYSGPITYGPAIRRRTVAPVNELRTCFASVSTDWERMAAVVATLPGQHRKLLKTCFLSRPAKLGQSLEQYARNTNKPYAKVVRQAATAIETLRRRLGNGGPPLEDEQKTETVVDDNVQLLEVDDNEKSAEVPVYSDGDISSGGRVWQADRIQHLCLKKHRIECATYRFSRRPGPLYFQDEGELARRYGKAVSAVERWLDVDFLHCAERTRLEWGASLIYGPSGSYGSGNAGIKSK